MKTILETDSTRVTRHEEQPFYTISYKPQGFLCESEGHHVAPADVTLSAVGDAEGLKQALAAILGDLGGLDDDADDDEKAEDGPPKRKAGRPKKVQDTDDSQP